MNPVTKPTHEFSLAELREKLKERGLPFSGTESELTTQLNEADPSGEWMRSREIREEESESEIEYVRRQLELSEREKALAERELDLTRQQIELLREMQRLSVRDQEREIVQRVSPVDISAIAELLSNFDGSANTFETWERRIIELRNTYKLSDDMVKLLIGSRLRGNALKWLHSRVEYVSMPLDELLDNLREMFYHPENVLVARRKFEARVWKREEPFSEYLHEKVILGNRVPINDIEIIEYIIEGIPDSALRDLARAQRIKTKKDLLESFERITLRG
ncbi:hypothetical protein QLX08_004378 [Tetragonisca angustula]|uniref:SAP domain-containing protein n=1 Tax=Tetragonisca angustula TaxID=166442 RepID=A0AAW1A2W7_9HYME